MSRFANTAPRPPRSHATPSPQRASQQIGWGQAPRQMGTAALPSLRPESPTLAPIQDPVYVSEIGDTTRKMAFGFALAYMFLRFSLFHEVLSELLGGRNVYMVAVLGPLAILTAMFGGGITRMLRNGAPIKLFLGFMVWLWIAAPFSIWKGGTISYLLPVFQTEFSLVLIVGGVVVGMAECQKLFRCLALCSAIDVLVSQVFSSYWDGRLGVSFGTLANPNDYATHLILTLPFLLFVYLTDKKAVIRVGSFLMICFGLYVILLTGSRGALLALGVVFGLILLRATMVQSVVMVVLVAVVGVAGIAAMPAAVRVRYTSMFTDSVTVNADTARTLQESEGSTNARTELLKAGVKLAVENPLFGVGPGQFSVGENELAKLNGFSRGAWQVSHNSYTEVASEAGLPAFFLFAGALISGFLGLSSIYSRAKAPQFTTIRNAAFCLMISLLGFSCCIFFASMAYHYQVPTVVALVSVFIISANRELKRGSIPKTV